MQTILEKMNELRSRSLGINSVIHELFMDDIIDKMDFIIGMIEEYQENHLALVMNSLSNDLDNMTADDINFDEPATPGLTELELRETYIKDLHLSSRTIGCLTRHKIKTVWDLLLWSAEGLAAIKGFGIKSVVQIEEYLRSIGCELRKEHVE